jgi:hypothetical protein
MMRARWAFVIVAVLPAHLGRTGSAWERTPWHAVQHAAWEALRRTSRNG